MIDPKSLMNLPQRVLWGQMRQLEGLARGTLIKEFGADHTLFDALDTMGKAMDELAVPPDADSGNKPPRSDAWEPYAPVERWILRDGSGTGSARDMACCYLAHLIGFKKIDPHEIYRGNLDREREALVTAMLAAPRPADFPRPPFWRIYWRYEETLRRELERQGVAAPGV
jgi:hypothetical protein